ncbi:hypothetical protein [Streptomyces stelliscabiei]|uniref:hypothetical protein n=1 Tax=Streptomyces stelliscabiei TaxID=146820 RepID=UPI0029A635B9|nr:hypothetical protein [Streptomyces stelliscabiei]MDX2554722.1 hypothetical protein [Streptomyces stelliscabiei]MDX2613249.1 hypothetical protein [Streptomyces stelliscabiei]MDX2638475.1 hypothetical protein [Streptomyces stelliscabiei]MDX2661627.1 hypothetical protein [Streptomyces stelliscabiei]MDX2712240.1 hypothetical protein [Streptomyces stelliscabiei]
MASVAARRVLRDRVRANRAASAQRRTVTQAARRVRTGARSLVTHIIATGADRKTVEGVADALRTVAKKKGVKGRRARIRRSFNGARNIVKTVYRYTRAQVAQIAAQYKPRKAEYKAVRAALIAA